jgi:hypothetical protein
MLDPITSGSEFTNHNGGGSNNPSSARHRRAPERPAKKSPDEPTGDGTDRASDH